MEKSKKPKVETTNRKFRTIPLRKSKKVLEITEITEKGSDFKISDILHANVYK